MDFPENYYEDEVREGFYVPAIMKRNWAAGIEVLMELNKICTKYGLQWFLSYGSLIGAVRHKGYIPWDDDLDIMMKRKDFNELKKHKDEFPEGYVIACVQDMDDYDSPMATVNVDMAGILTPEQMVRYHGFPYNVGVDIFMLDEVSDDTERESERMEYIYRFLDLKKRLLESDIKDRIGIIDEFSSKYGLKIDCTKSITHQIYKSIDEAASRFSGEKSKYLVYMDDYMQFGTAIFDAEVFEKTISMRFEKVMLPVPLYYEIPLRDTYGDYNKIEMGTAFHDYPNFIKWEKQIRKFGTKLPYLYEFDKAALVHDKPDRKTLKEKIQIRISKLIELNNLAKKTISAGAGDMISEIMALCQKTAIETGELVEKSAKDPDAIVRYLEEYCEAAYKIYEGREGVELQSVLYEMEYIVSDIERELDEIKEKTEIVMLPFKASAWDTMKPYYDRYKDDPAVNLHVVPIPYYLRGRDNSPGSEIYEGKALAGKVPVEDYRTFPFEDMKPHVIVIQNPYDEYSMGSEVNRYFFSDNLKMLCDKLVYIPWFVTDDIDIDDEKCRIPVANMRHYVTVPGCVSADLIYVPTENLRKSYIRVLTEFCGEETKERWEKCVHVMT